MVETMKKLFKDMDKPLLIVTVILCVIGLVMVFSASSISAVLQYKVNTYYFFTKQLIFMLIGFIIGFTFLLRVPTSKYHYVKSLLMIIIVILLGGLILYGTVTNGSKSWYKIGPVSLQPSEFAKTVVVLYMACYFGKNINCTKRFFFLRPIIACAIVVGLIFLQPDLGTAVIIALCVFGMFLALPFSKKDKDVKVFKIIGSVLVLCAIVLMVFGGDLLSKSSLGQKILTGEQLSRLTYRAPCSRYQEKTGYQVCNGIIAINSGGLFGVGLGNSTQKYLYLPEAHTDFIFPIIVEELGSIAGIIIILLYIYMLYRILKIAKSARDLTGSLIAYGTFLTILLHLIINFGGILAIIPLTGVPVPLLSYGGSVTLNTLIMLFLTLRVSIEAKEDKLKKISKK